MMSPDSVLGDFVSTTPGSTGGPPLGTAYKRAVYKRAPKRFTVEMLPPTRQGGNYSFGIRICPLFNDAASVQTTNTAFTRTPIADTEYEIWRRWEDCLYLQEVLEAEYNSRAKLRRQDLAAGRGVEKNGVYIRSGQAASFESLPPGPDPKTIEKDVHAYLPRLTKKGTLFRASPATVEQRNREFTALVKALLSPDLPPLLREVRANRTIRDFFGYWRRDHDLQRKALRLRKSGGTSTRGSIASSAFSLYFSASTSSLHSPAWANHVVIPPVPRLIRGGEDTDNKTVSSSSLRSSRRRSSPSPMPDVHQDGSWQVPASAPATSARSFTLSSNSSESSILPEKDSPRSPYAPSPAGLIKGARSLEPMVAPHDLPRLQVREAAARRLSGGHLLPPTEVDWRDPSRPARVPEALSAVDSSGLPPQTPRLRSMSGAGSDAGRAKRIARIFETPPRSPADDDTDDQGGDEEGEGEDRLGSLGRRISASRRTQPPWSINPEPVRSLQRDSVALIATLGRPASTATSVSFDFDAADFPIPPETDKDLADVFVRQLGIGSQPYPGTLPHRPQSPEQVGVRRSLSAGSMHSRKQIVSLEEDPDLIEDDDSIIDAYFSATNPRNTQCSTSSRQRVSMRHPGAFHLPWTPVPTSPTTSTQPAVTPVPLSPSLPSAVLSPSSGASDVLAVKAAFGDVIVVFRIPRSTSLSDVRLRITDKLAEQGRTPSTTFTLAYSVSDPSAPSSRPGTAGSGRIRSNSVSSVGDTSQLRLIASDREWAELVAVCGSKITLRVLDSKN